MKNKADRFLLGLVVAGVVIQWRLLFMVSLHPEVPDNRMFPNDFVLPPLYHNRTGSSSRRKSLVEQHVLQHRELTVDDSSFIRAERNISFVWNGDVSRKVRQENMQAVNSVKLTVVISHCDKPLQWIAQLLEMSEDRNIVLESIHVLSKCGKQVKGTAELRSLVPSNRGNFTVTRLANVGRNDHSYATWILNNYESILQPPYAPTDVVLFLKDNNYRFFQPGQKYFLTFDHVVTNAITQGFGCLELLRHNRRWRPRSGMPVVQVPRCLSAFHSLKHLRQFSIEGYSREKRRDHIDHFSSPNYTNVGEWIDALGINLPGISASLLDASSVQHESRFYPVVPVCYGGQFAVTRGQLRSTQPKSVFEKMSTLLSRDDNIAEGHFSERTWSSMFTRPLTAGQLRDFKVVAKHVASSDSISKSRHGVVVGMRVSNFACEPMEDFLHPSYNNNA